MQVGIVSVRVLVSVLYIVIAASAATIRKCDMATEFDFSRIVYGVAAVSETSAVVATDVGLFALENGKVSRLASYPDKIVDGSPSVFLDSKKGLWVCSGYEASEDPYTRVIWFAQSRSSKKSLARFDGQRWITWISKADIVHCSDTTFTDDPVRFGRPDHAYGVFQHANIGVDLTLVRSDNNTGSILYRDGVLVQKSDSLMNGQLQAVKTDSKGTTWLAYKDRCLAIGADGSVRKYDIATGYAPLNLYDIVEDPAGTLWFLAADFKSLVRLVALRFDGTSFLFHDDSKGLGKICQQFLGLDSRGRMYSYFPKVKTNMMATQYFSLSKTLTFIEPRVIITDGTLNKEIVIPGPEGAKLPMGYVLTCMSAPTSDVIWAGSSNVIYRLKEDIWTQYSFAEYVPKVGRFLLVCAVPGGQILAIHKPYHPMENLNNKYIKNEVLLLSEVK
jgi:hypothetical protein